MFTCVKDSTELRPRGGSSSQGGWGSNRSRRSSMEEAMREQQERFCEELRQHQMAFVQQQSEYMTAYNAKAEQAMNVSVLFILNMVVYLFYN
jgi:predicted RNase H-like nuclease (RuvC/YqgF family)